MRLTAADRWFMGAVAAVTLSSTFALSQVTPTTLTADINKAKLVWNWTQGTGGPAEKFVVKCGPTAGTYPTLLELPDPAARSVPVNKVATKPGQYFCVVVAANSIGQGGASNEVSFQAGQTPDSATGLTLVP